VKLEPRIFNRLKSLPLTILLTVLIWMYAEAQFTNTQENVQLNVKLVTPSPDLAVRAIDPVRNRPGETIHAVVTLQGPRNQLDAIFQQSQGVPDEEFASLTYQPRQRDLHAGEEATVDVVTMLNSLNYFRSRRVTVISAAPPRVQLEVDQMVHLAKPPDFRPAMVVDRAVLSEDTVTVNVPAAVLDRLGGPTKIAVVAEPQRPLATLKSGTDQAVAVKYVADYAGPRDDRITVTPPIGMVNVRIPASSAATETVPEVQIWASGPPSLLAKYDVTIQPRSVKVTLAGSPAAIAAFHENRNVPGVHAYVDLTPDDVPSEAFIRRRVRYTLPDGLSLQDATPDVEFRLIEKPAAAPAPAPAPAPVPATGETPATQPH
jgi:hypothetical protein